MRNKSSPKQRPLGVLMGLARSGWSGWVWLGLTRSGWSGWVWLVWLGLTRSGWSGWVWLVWHTSSVQPPVPRAESERLAAERLLEEAKTLIEDAKIRVGHLTMKL